MPGPFIEQPSWGQSVFNIPFITKQMFENNGKQLRPESWFLLMWFKHHRRMHKIRHPDSDVNKWYESKKEYKKRMRKERAL